MKQSESIASLAGALVKAQGEMVSVSKDSSNPDFRSKYASLDTIIEHIRPVLAKHGLAVLQGATAPDRDEAGRVAAFSVETTLMHASGEWITNAVVVPVVGRMLKGGGIGEVTPQSAGSALSYGRRYGLSALLSIATDEDDDGKAASTPRPAAPAKPATAHTGSAAKLMPMGKQKGAYLGDIASPALESTIEWCTSDAEKAEKFKDLIAACSDVINARRAA